MNARLLRPARSRFAALAGGSRHGHRGPARARRWRTRGSTRRRRSGSARRRALLAVGQVLSQPGTPAQCCGGWRARWPAPSAPTWSASTRSTPARDALMPVAGYHVPKELLPHFLTRRPSCSRACPSWRRPGARGGRCGRRTSSATRASTPRWCGGLDPAARVLFAPTLVHGEPVGALSSSGGRPAASSRRAEIRLLEGIAAQVGLAMENVELARQTARKLRGDGDAAVGEPHGLVHARSRPVPRQFLRHVARVARRRHHRPLAGGRVGRVARALRGLPRAHRAARGEPRTCGCRSPSTSSTRRRRARGARSSRPTRSTTPASRTPSAQQAPHRTHLFVPIVAKDRMIGGFAVTWRRPGAESSTRASCG